MLKHKEKIFFNFFAFSGYLSKSQLFWKVHNEIPDLTHSAYCIVNYIENAYVLRSYADNNPKIIK